MTIQLLTNEDFVKSILGGYLSLNLAGEYLSTAMFEAQEIGLKSIIGGRLLRTMQDKESRGEMTGVYAELKEECQLYLAYQSVANVMPKVAYKTGNIGVVQTSDTNAQPVSKEVLDSCIEDVIGKADFFCAELQRWCIDHCAQLPELGNQSRELRANLRSMASCGIFLGGARGLHNESGKIIER